MPSFSPSIPGLTSGDSSSISSFDTTSSSALTRAEEIGIPVGRISQTQSQIQSRQYERERQQERQRRRSSLVGERVAIITSRMGSASGSGSGSGSGYRGNTRAERSTTSRSHSSWSTATPSISSVPSQPITHNTAGNGAENGEDVDITPDTNRIYTCLFHMLDCHESFDDENHWNIHVLSHFRTHPPPRTARCPLCPNTNFVDGDSNPVPLSSISISEKNQGRENSPEYLDGVMRRVDSGTDVREDGPYTSIEQPATPNTLIEGPDGSESEIPGLDIRDSGSSSGSGSGSAWRRLLDHVGEHYRSGHTLAGSRADFELMRYLYGRRIISDAQFKAMQLAPAPSSPAYHASQDGVRASIGSADEPYYAPYSRRREERMRGQQKGVSVGVV
ncbi:uncharacterized protein N7469_001624 [Penicillium citrinum]|uniref:Uncharacterized protein n=1 Tax=Penicillium citrinum TaxID=5077 RepID=A0A9W9PGH9_PENCI|nr:uncharacterized protein N7469_001624 [Penicillium citrinum]KAJ5243297.1 hypothetical protein N7469_001624 [Penicillium citrinum]